MPSPTAADKDLCPNSAKQLHHAATQKSGWLVCKACGRALKRTRKAKLLGAPIVVLGNHRVRGKNTRSLDNTRDVLVLAGYAR